VLEVKAEEGVSISSLLTIGEVARRAGFTLGEIRSLLYVFPAGTGAAERRRTLATEKLGEVDEAIAQLRTARDLLWEALRCQCGSLDECARLLSES
jgi:MerR family redox-sensitive transcriptional activator SoxR